MAMINAFLIAYMFTTMLLFASAYWKVYQNKKKEVKKPAPVDISSKDMVSLKEALHQTFGAHVMAEIHTVPETPEEAIMVQSRLILSAIKDLDGKSYTWINALRNSADVNKQDMNALLHAVDACTRGVLELQDKKSDTPKVKENVETFLHSLEYARDTYAKTETEKVAIQGVITNIKTTHGAK